MVEGTEVKHLGYDFDNMDFYKRFLDGVGWTESRSTVMAADTKQVGGGDARGFLQVEGGRGSRRNETMLTRARNYYALYPDSPTNEEIAFLIQQEDKDIDFSTLSKETQKLLFYIDGAMHKDLSLGDLATGKLPEEWAYARFWQRGKDLEKAANTYDTAQLTNPNRLEEQKPPDASCRPLEQTTLSTGIHVILIYKLYLIELLRSMTSPLYGDTETNKNKMLLALTDTAN